MEILSEFIYPGWEAVLINSVLATAFTVFLLTYQWNRYESALDRKRFVLPFSVLGSAAVMIALIGSLFFAQYMLAGVLAVFLLLHVILHVMKLLTLTDKADQSTDQAIINTISRKMTKFWVFYSLGLTILSLFFMITAWPRSLGYLPAILLAYSVMIAGYFAFSKGRFEMGMAAGAILAILSGFTTLIIVLGLATHP